MPWSTFVSAHPDSIVASDFFTQTVWTWRGRMEAYCLFFIHLGSRKLYCSPVTLHPNEEWMMQQARNRRPWMGGGRCRSHKAARSPEGAEQDAKRNNFLDPDFAPAEQGAVKCEAKLGGLLRHYYREAA